VVDASRGELHRALSLEGEGSIPRTETLSLEGEGANACAEGVGG